MYDISISLFIIISLDVISQSVLVGSLAASKCDLTVAELHGWWLQLQSWSLRGA